MKFSKLSDIGESQKKVELDWNKFGVSLDEEVLSNLSVSLE